jgi:hypothetical protein
MNNEWLTAFFMGGLVLIALDITRRALIEMQRIEHEQRIKNAMRRLRRPQHVWVTVLLYGEDGETAFERTKRQIQRNRYEHFDVVRVKKHTAAGYRTAYQKSRRGEIILCVRAGDFIDRQCIKRAVVLQTIQSRRHTHAKTQCWRIPILKPALIADGLRGVAERLRLAVWQPSPAYIEVYTRRGLRTRTDVKTLAVKRTHHVAIGGLVTIFAILLGASVHVVAFLYIWTLFSVYIGVLVWLSAPTSTGTFRAKLQLTFAVPSALLLMPVASFIGGVVQLSSRK